MADDAAIKRRIKELMVERLRLDGISPDEIEDDKGFEWIGLDSVDALELVVGLEKRFGVKIRSQEIDPGAFASANAFYEFVTGEIAGRSGAVG